MGRAKSPRSYKCVAQIQNKGQQSRNMGRTKSHHVPRKILVAVRLALPALLLIIYRAATSHGPKVRYQQSFWGNNRDLTTKTAG